MPILSFTASTCRFMAVRLPLSLLLLLALSLPVVLVAVLLAAAVSSTGEREADGGDEDAKKTRATSAVTLRSLGVGSAGDHAIETWNASRVVESGCCDCDCDGGVVAVAVPSLLLGVSGS